MKVLLVDVDSTIPNIALMKLSRFHKQQGDTVDFIKCNISYYPKRKKFVTVDSSKYDKVFVSTIFKNCLEYVKFNTSDNLVLGGTGYDLKVSLPDEVNSADLDYSIYPENDTSYGFISRGCNRKCYFCVVPEKEGKIKKEDSIDQILKHKKVKFLDNNFLQYPEHKEVMRELISKNIKCQFMQGLDIRMVDESNSILLSKLNYMGEYIFAFDDFKYKRYIQKKLELCDWRKDWQFKFYVYVHPDMELWETVKRIEWLKEQKCLPYIMRDLSCYGSKYEKFYTDIASYCNQPAFFKSMTFKEFISKRTKKQDRVDLNSSLYNTALEHKTHEIFEIASVL